MISVHLNYRTAPSVTAKVKIEIEGEGDSRPWSQYLTFHEAHKLRDDLTWILAEYNRITPPRDDEEAE